MVYLFITNKAVSVISHCVTCVLQGARWREAMIIKQNIQFVLQM